MCTPAQGEDFSDHSTQHMELLQLQQCMALVFTGTHKVLTQKLCPSPKAKHYLWLLLPSSLRLTGRSTYL